MEVTFLTQFWAHRLVRAYGTEAREMLGGAREARYLGEDFGATLTEAELRWLMAREYARTAEDVLWRRSKLGLRLDAEAVDRIERRMRDFSRNAGDGPAEEARPAASAASR